LCSLWLQLWASQISIAGPKGLQKYQDSQINQKVNGNSISSYTENRYESSRYFHVSHSNFKYIFVLSTGSEGISCACNKYLAGSLVPAKDLLQKKVLLPKPMQTEVPYRNN